MGLAFNVEVRLCSVPIPHLQLFFFFFLSLSSAFWSQRMEMLHFSYGDCDTFVLWKRIFHDDDFSVGLYHPILSYVWRARGQSPGPQGDAQTGKGMSVSFTQVTIPSIGHGGISIRTPKDCAQTPRWLSLGCPHPEP